MPRTVLATLATVATIATASADAADKAIRVGHVEANGLSYYYEMRGEGEPLLLLHGGLGTADMFAPILPALGEGRRVIGVDLHGHGRTRLGDRAIDLADIGDDLAMLIRELELGPVDVLGYSFGGGAGLQLALRHPELVRRLVVVSAGFGSDGFYPEIRAQQVMMGAEAAPFMSDTPMYHAYVAVAPDPDEFPRLLQAMGDMMRTDYDWSHEIGDLATPTMLVYGDGDMYRPEHIVRFYQLLGGWQGDAGWMRETMPAHRLAILPNQTHYDIFFSPRLAATVRPFLDGTDAPGAWADHAGGGQ